MNDTTDGRTPSGELWCVDESELTPVPDDTVVFESGGNARISRCRLGGDDFLFKEYRPAHLDDVDEIGLARLIAWRVSLPAAEQAELDGLASWPRCRVMRDGRLRGVLIPLAGDRFLRRGNRGTRTPRSMHDLCSTWQRPAAPLHEKLRAFSHAIDTVLWFHRRGIVMNDVQQDNYLLAPDGSGLYVVDCDSMIAPALWGAVAPPAAPEHILAAVPDSAHPTIATDLAKLALIIMRTLIDQPAITQFGPELIATVSAVTSPEIAAFLDRALSSRDPDAGGWRSIADAWVDADMADTGPDDGRFGATDPVRLAHVPVGAAPPLVLVKRSGSRMPPSFDYRPGPAPVLRPRVYTFKRPRWWRSNATVFAILAFVLAILLAALFIVHPDLLDPADLT